MDDTDPGRRCDITDPPVIDELKAIAEQDPDGLIQPHVVVEQARRPQSALHRFFEWDDTAAASAYRLAQARQLITRVRFEVTVSQGPQLVNVKITSSEGGQRQGYVPVDRAVRRPDLFKQILADARRGIASYRARLQAFEQAQMIVDHLDSALKEIDEAS
jgi:hypothetical protein